jgi:hypothetical protein
MDSLLVAKIYIHKRKVPGEKVENRYESIVCNHNFIGAYEN